MSADTSLTDAQAKTVCDIDLGAARRIALRAPILGDPLSVRPTTVMSRLDSLVEHVCVNRPIALGSVLAAAARIDPGSQRIFAQGLPQQIREDMVRRKSGAMKDVPPLVVRPKPAGAADV